MTGNWNSTDVIEHTISRLTETVQRMEPGAPRKAICQTLGTLTDRYFEIAEIEPPNREPIHADTMLKALLLAHGEDPDNWSNDASELLDDASLLWVPAIEVLPRLRALREWLKEREHVRRNGGGECEAYTKMDIDELWKNARNKKRVVPTLDRFK